MQKDIRFIQRYEYFTLALSRLREAVDIVEMTELETNGFVQRFEFTLELAWKTMRDFLTEE
jgi:Nucleotidyltransferase substrate binding protein like